MKPKLTKPQEALLREVMVKGETICSGEYKPAKKLIENELVDFETLRYGRVKLIKKH